MLREGQGSAAAAWSFYERVAVCAFRNGRVILVGTDGNAVERAVVLRHQIVLALGDAALYMIVFLMIVHIQRSLICPWEDFLIVPRNYIYYSTQIENYSSFVCKKLTIFFVDKSEFIWYNNDTERIMNFRYLYFLHYPLQPPLPDGGCNIFV